MDNKLDSLAVVLLVVITLVIEAKILISLVIRFYYFRRDLLDLQNEIRRSEGSERRYWQREKKRLWLSLIPFYDKIRRR